MDATQEAVLTSSETAAKAPAEPPASALKPPRKQIHSLDLMKCLGILIVVFYHCRLIIVPNIRTDHSLDQYFFYGVTTLLGPCVPFFFLVNGYLLFNRPLDMKKHVRKIFHFIVITLIWSGITLFTTLYAYGYQFNFSVFGHSLFVLNPEGYPVTLRYFIRNTILIKNLIADGQTGWFYHLWFMGAMVILYLFFPMLKLAWDKQRNVFYYFCAAVFIIVFGNSALNMLYNVAGWLIKGTNPAAAYEGAKVFTGNNFLTIFNPFPWIDGYIFVYFMLGAIIRENEEKFKEIFKPWVCIVGIIVTTLCLYLYGYFMTMSCNRLWNSGDQNGNDIIFSLVRVICIFGLCSRYRGEGLKGKVIRYIGNNTMGVYFIHYILRNMTYKQLQDLPIPGYLLKTTVYFVVIFAASCLMTELMKRVPHIKKLVS